MILTTASGLQVKIMSAYSPPIDMCIYCRHTVCSVPEREDGLTQRLLSPIKDRHLRPFWMPFPKVEPAYRHNWTSCYKTNLVCVSCGNVARARTVTVKATTSECQCRLLTARQTQTNSITGHPTQKHVNLRPLIDPPPSGTRALLLADDLRDNT